MFGLTRISSITGLGLCIALSGCADTQSIESDGAAEPSDTQVADASDAAAANVPETPSGPQSGDLDTDVQTVEQELLALEQLEGTTVLAESNISVELTPEAEDFRSTDDTILEIESTSEDGHYVIGRIGDAVVARISLKCADDQPAGLLIIDLDGRDYVEHWVPMVDRLVPSFVAASGCESVLVGSPTDCLDLPDDPAACIPGEGVEEQTP